MPASKAAAEARRVVIFCRWPFQQCIAGDFHWWK
jgi:hypothetical protein